MDTPAKDLSGGEKARLLMGLAAFEAPNLLILDEPTNHLDMDSRRALIEALNDYSGAVILISHDRYLIEATVDRLWVVNNGTVSRSRATWMNIAILSSARTGRTRRASRRRMLPGPCAGAAQIRTSQTHQPTVLKKRSTNSTI